jgi:uncharacterized protein YyaL (SSP411 family)
MTGNLLGRETSPYLLQHKDNPVHWRPWGIEAFAEATTHNKPVLLSIGYAACHWCHVMAHESFEDAETAAQMNAGFINIKVDREERPDVDAIYQSALALIGEHGGWPLTMFLTPAGDPFWGGTYYPPEPRYGRPGFRELLNRVIEVYRQSPDKVADNAASLRGALDRLSRPRRGGDLPPEFLGQAATTLLRAADPDNGGIGQAPKFPQPSLLELLWRGFRATGNPALSQAVSLTLDRMAMGGIYDHLGGGYARYSVDAEWLVPHFEKMLYDNAQLVNFMTLVWQETRNPLFAARIAETIDWALREMRVGDAFASSFDADSAGHEGKFYVWSEEEIDRLLGGDSAVFKQAYDVTDEGNWENTNILRRLVPLGADPGLDQKLAACRGILFRARLTRVPPMRDDKVLTDWNGLMISALANAGAVFDKPAWIAAAQKAFDFIVGKLSDGARLFHSFRDGQARHRATLDDYANMAQAALALFEATADRGYLEHAESWVRIADEHFWDAQSGGYFFTANDSDDLITRTKTAMDGPVPAGNGSMAMVLAKLFHLTAKSDYGARALSIVHAFSGEIAGNFYSFPTLIAANDLLANAVEIVIIGKIDAPDTKALLRAVYGLSLPNRVLQIVEPGTELPSNHPASGRGQTDGKATAYVCRHQACSLPVAAAAGLSALLKSNRGISGG